MKTDSRLNLLDDGTLMIHAGDGPGHLPVHGEECGRGGEDAGGDPQVLPVSR